MTSKVEFGDSACDSFTIQSCWKLSGSQNNFSCQTDSYLYEFSEAECVTGISTEIIQDEVSKTKGASLLAHFCRTHKMVQNKKDISEIYWRAKIAEGRVTVDNEVIVNENQIVEKDNFIEFVSKTANADVSRKIFSNI